MLPHLQISHRARSPPSPTFRSGRSAACDSQNHFRTKEITVPTFQLAPPPAVRFLPCAAGEGDHAQRGGGRRPHAPTQAAAPIRRVAPPSPAARRKKPTATSGACPIYQSPHSTGSFPRKREPPFAMRLRTATHSGAFDTLRSPLVKTPAFPVLSASPSRIYPRAFHHAHIPPHLPATDGTGQTDGAGGQVGVGLRLPSRGSGLTPG